ncbi:hypothetical protein PCANB_003001 [Pneumocystis canis]|nr:hypothetical protein PCANB_003001 [Pneumocystis canis]
MTESFQTVSYQETGTQPIRYDLDAGIIRCICGLEEDDGFTIQCERCYVWQHAVCVGIDQLHVPDEYLCDLCLPRPLDVKKAIEKQRRRKEQESMHASTNHSSVKRRRQLSYGPVKSKINLTSIKEKSCNSMIKHENNRKSRSNHRFIFSKELENQLQTMEVIKDSDLNINPCYNSEYSTIEHNLVTSVEAKVYISLLLQDRSRMLIISNDCFSSKYLPATSIRSVLRNDFPSMLRFSLYADQFIPSSKIIKEFKGEIYLQDEYKIDSVNQYSFLLAPKPFVYFISDSKLCIDTRRYGTDSRFIRRSCKPNAKLITAASDDDPHIHIVLFSLTEIHPGLEITIDWNWDINHPANILENHEYIPEDEIKYTQNLIYFIAESECACELGEECILFRLKRLFANISKNSIKSDRSLIRLENDSGGINKSQGINESSELFVRMASGTESVSNDALSAREKRKIKDILARIEKLEQEETQITKKRKQKNDGKSGETHKAYGYHRKMQPTSAKQVCQQPTSPLSSLPNSSKNDFSNIKPLSQRPGRIPSRISRMQKHKKITNGILKEYSGEIDTSDILPCKKMWIKRWMQENLKIDVEKIMRKDKQKLKNNVSELQLNIDSEMSKHTEIVDPIKHESPSPSSDMTLLRHLLPNIESSGKLSLDFTSPEPTITVPVSDPSQLSDKPSTPSLFKPDPGFSSTSESHMSSFTVASPLTSELEPIQSNVLLTSPTSILESLPKKISLSEYRKRKSANEVLTSNEETLCINHY